MSYSDLYLSKSPLISSPPGEPAVSVVGVPFDSTHSYRPGCRFGPDAMRDSLNNIEVFFPELGADLESVPIDDMGNLAHTVDAEQMLQMVGRVAGEVSAKRPVLFFGGEHLITLGSYMALPESTGYVVFDAHYDLRDSLAGARLSHASYLRRIVEERGAGAVLHVGGRACAAEEAEFLKESGIRCVTDAQVRDGRGPQLLKDWISGFGSIYASFDIDVLDPGFAPGVGNPEPEGLTPRELFAMVRAMGGARIAGADIVELCPPQDNGSTAAAAARVAAMLAAIASR